MLIYISLVSLDVKKDTDSITFNTAELTLGPLTVTSSAFNEPQVHPSSVLTLDKATERATLKLTSKLVEGSTVQVRIPFEADLTGGLMGYYRSAYEADGKTKYYSLTQFEVCSYLCYLNSYLQFEIAIIAYRRTSRIPLLG